MIIRLLTINDAEEFVKLVQQVEKESDFLLWEPGERKMTPEQQRKRIESMMEESNSTIFVAEIDKKLVGYLVVIGGSAKRNKHSCYLVIGILKEFRGKGIGTKLFEELQRWARERNIHRLELTVVTQNEAALALYTKMGFKMEGIKKHSLLINSEYFDEYYMSKLL
jgi:RimJ/RimL family protein N-acetyltransferase